MASPIGKPGRNPGPGKTNFVGTGAGRNLGRRTASPTGGSGDQSLKRRGLNAGPGGHLRPPTNLTKP